MDTKIRLLEFLDYLNIGQTAFEKKVGIANGYISHNKGSIGSETISKISDAYPDLNLGWLITGKGEMLKSTNKEEKINENKYVELLEENRVLSRENRELYKYIKEIEREKFIAEKDAGVSVAPTGTDGM